MLLPPCLDEAVQPHPYMRCSVGFHPLWFCLLSATATLKTYSARVFFCKRCIHTGRWRFLRILSRNVGWGASRPFVKIRFPFCALYTSSTPALLVAQTRHTICRNVDWGASKNSLKIHFPLCSFYKSSIPGPPAAQMTHTICTLAFHVPEHSLKIHPLASFCGTQTL